MHVSKITRALIFLLLIALLGLRFWFFFDKRAPTLPRSDLLVGVIDSDPEDKGLAQVFTLRVQSPNEREVIRVLVQTARYPRYSYGDRVEISGRALFRPRSFTSDNGKVFEYGEFLAKDDIYYQVKNPEVRLVGHDEGNPVVALLIKLKRSFLSNITDMLGEPHASLAGGLVVGEKNALGKDLIDDFRRAGLIHIVVLSGYNITIIAAAMRKILSIFSRSTSIILGGVAMVLFCVLVGGGATVVRSCIMGMIALVGELLYRPYGVMRALIIAGYCMLFHNPSILLYDPSFQLSFLATLALILLASPMEGLLSKLRVPETLGIRGLIATTLATQILVSPFIFYLMGEVSIIGVIVNILVLPIIPLTMLVIAIVGIGGFLSGAISFVFSIPAQALLSYELWVVGTFSSVSGATISVMNFSFTTTCVVYGLYVAAYFYFWRPATADPNRLSTILQLRLAKKSST